MPRIRSVPKIAPAMVRATIARRSIFMRRSVPTCTGRGHGPGYRARMELRIVRLTDHFDEACRFYGNVLGWPVTREWPADGDQGRGRIFGYGDVGRVELIEVAATQPVSGLFLSVEVDDVTAIAQRLAAGGIALHRDLADQPWGHRNLAVIDPAGIEVVFFQWIGTAH